MDLKLFWGTFAAIFLAEMGDKTQLAAFALAGGGNSKMSVFIAASLALIATTAIAVLAGGVVGKYVPELWLKRGAGALFVILGIAMLVATRAPQESALAPDGSSDVQETSEGN